MGNIGCKKQKKNKNCIKQSKYRIIPWGMASSTLQLVDQLVDLLRQQGTGIKVKTAREFIKILEKTSPWFIHSGSLNILDWDQVKTDLQKTSQKEGPESVPVTAFSLWRPVRDALLNTDAKVKDQMFEIKELLE